MVSTSPQPAPEQVYPSEQLHHQSEPALSHIPPVTVLQNAVASVPQGVIVGDFVVGMVGLKLGSFVVVVVVVVVSGMVGVKLG